MEQKMCNVLYEATSNIVIRDAGELKQKLGYFTSDMDAEKAVQLYAQAVIATKNDLGMKVFDHVISVHYEPVDSKLKYYNNLQEFARENVIVSRYVERKQKSTQEEQAE